MTGTTRSNDFPTTAGAFQPTQPFWFGQSAADAFVAKFGDDTPPPPAPTRSEESAATQIGFWSTYGAETGSFSGGSVAASNVIGSTALFSFTGTAVSWIGVKCNVCGIALVSVDGGALTTVDTAGPNAPGGLRSESVFSASGLAATNHLITITVTGISRSAGAYVAVDAFDVTAGSATSLLLPPVVLRRSWDGDRLWVNQKTKSDSHVPPRFDSVSQHARALHVPRGLRLVSSRGDGCSRDRELRQATARSSRRTAARRTRRFAFLSAVPATASI